MHPCLWVIAGVVVWAVSFTIPHLINWCSPTYLRERAAYLESEREHRAYLREWRREQWRQEWRQSLLYRWLTDAATRKRGA